MGYGPRVEGVRARGAVLADGLTAGRAALAPVVALVLWPGRLGEAALVLSLCWVTDFLDGRVARMAGSGTRLGGFDLGADTLVGVGALLGVWLEGWLAWPVLLALLVGLGGTYLLLRNEAAAMLLQAAGYGIVLIRLVARRDPVVLVPLGLILVIGVVDRDRFTGDVLPRFFRGFVRPRGRD